MRDLLTNGVRVKVVDKDWRNVKTSSMPYLHKPESQQLDFNHNLPASTNKWNTAVSRKWGGSQVELRIEKDPLVVKKRLSCTFSTEALCKDVNELVASSDNSKPVLRAWASKNKINAAKRNSVQSATSSENLFKSSSTNYLQQSLSNSPWSKYFKPKGFVGNRPVSSDFLNPRSASKLDLQANGPEESAIKENSSTPQKHQSSHSHIQSKHDFDKSTCAVPNGDNPRSVSSSAGNNCDDNKHKYANRGVKPQPGQLKEHSELNKKKDKQIAVVKGRTRINKEVENTLQNNQSTGLSKTYPTLHGGNNFLSRHIEDCLHEIYESKSNEDSFSKENCDQSVSLHNNYINEETRLVRPKVYDNSAKVYTDIDDQITSNFLSKDKPHAVEIRRQTSDRLLLSTSQTHFDKRDVEAICKQIGEEVTDQFTDKEQVVPNTDSKMSRSTSSFDEIYSQYENNKSASFHSMGSSMSPKYDSRTANIKENYINEAAGVNTRRNSETERSRRNTDRVFTQKRSRSYSVDYSSRYHKYKISNDVITSSLGEPYVPKSAYLRKRLMETDQSCYSRSPPNTASFSTSYIGKYKPKGIDNTKVDKFINYYKERNKNMSVPNSPKLNKVFSSETTQDDSDEISLDYLTEGKVTRCTSKSSNCSEMESERKLSRDSGYDTLNRFSRDSDFDCTDISFKRTGSLKTSFKKINADKEVGQMTEDNSKSKLMHFKSCSPKISDNQTDYDDDTLDYKRSSVAKGLDDINKQLSTVEDPSAMNDVDMHKKQSPFGSITRVSASKISGVDELKSFSHRRRNKQRANVSEKDPDCKVHPKSNEDEPKSALRFSLRKMKSDPPSSPKFEKSRKHSISTFLGFRKDNKESPPTSPSLSPRGSVDYNDARRESCSPDSELSTSAASQRRGFAIYRLFHKKSHSFDGENDAIAESHSETLTENDDVETKPKSRSIVSRVSSASISLSRKVHKEEDVKKHETDDQHLDKHHYKSIRERVTKSLSITINSKKKNLSAQTSTPVVVGKTTENQERITSPEVVNECKKQDSETLLSLPVQNELSVSSDSLYDEATGKKYSKNRERIRNRKAARKEALDKTKLNEDSSPNTECFSPKNVEEPSKVTPKPTRKKHKARRANTEFIASAPVMDNPSDSLQTSRDDGVVMRRNNKRNNRANRPKTLMSGIDSELIFGGNNTKDDTGVIKENMSFADIKKKLLEGLTDTKPVQEKVPQKERQKIKRTKSTKRYKTITEGIAPRDLELARQAMQEQNDAGGLPTENIDEISVALLTNTDKRKSYIVEDHKNKYRSTEDLRSLQTTESNTNEDGAKKRTKKAVLKRTKSMTTINMNLANDGDDGEDTIKPLSEVKNRFLKAMEDTRQKHLNYKTPIDLKRNTNNDNHQARNDHPHTGLDDFTIDKLVDELHPEKEDSSLKTSQKDLESEKNGEQTAEKSNGKQKVDSKKLFDDLFDDLEDIMNEGLTEAELADALGCNPSLHQAVPALNLNVVDNKSKQYVEPPKLNIEKVENNSEPMSDLDFISSQTKQLSSSLATNKRSIRPTRRHRSGTNPVKVLQNRDDLIDETELEAKSKECRKSYHPVVEAFKGIRQTAENKKSPLLPRRSDLAEEAINALRCTVDFSKTILRKVEVGEKTIVMADGFEVSNITNLLLKVKGRRKCQTTVVEYTPDSLNCNDCFVLLTPKELYCWSGAQANVIEKAKAAEVASRINQKKEMGCKALQVVYLDQGGPNDVKLKTMLGAPKESLNDAISYKAMDDEDYEKTVVSAYMTYVVCEAEETPELVPLESQCHRMPSREILLTDSVFVFDFLTEFYVWVGRQTNSQQRKMVQKLAFDKFNEGYYELDMDNLHSLSQFGKSRRISVKPEKGRRGSKHGRRAAQQGRHQKGKIVARPEHALLSMLFEGTEWVIFKEKFCDWPDEGRIIRMKGGPEGEVIKLVSTEINIKVVDPLTMTQPKPVPKMILESYDMGRGRGIPIGMDGYHVITLDVKTWHVSENNSILMPDESFGQFHSGEGYVIRWQYRIVKVRALRNLDDPLKAGGTERCCYYFWLGNDCSVNEEGATAVMTIELDREKGPQIRTVLGKEPPALLQMFDGNMVIHAGKRPAPGLRTTFSDNSSIRLYCVRGETDVEACLLQVPAVCESLRSRSSFLLLLCQQGEVFLWHGCSTNEGTRKTAEFGARQFIANHPAEAAIATRTEIGLTEIEEGEEPDVFWMALDGKEDYGSLLNEDIDVSDLSPRLFQLESTTNEIVANEVLCPSRRNDCNCPFPVLQDDLYNVEQPAIFLLDSKPHVYLWLGWWPDDDEMGVSASRLRRWDEEKKKSMESTVLYAKEMGRDLNNLFVVYAGLEPESFIELFPYWIVQDDITDLQIDLGIEEDKLCLVTEELSMFTKDFYPLEELRAKPPPQGVDPTKLEKYLSDEDFMDCFHFPKETFYSLPSWQQVNWKKKLDLY